MAPPVVYAGDQRVTLHWVAPVLDGADLVKYQLQIQQLPGSGAWTYVELDPPNTTRPVVGGLANDTQYEFRVRAVSSGGVGPWSPPVTMMPEDTAVSPPMAPEPERTSTAGTAMTVFWAPPTYTGGTNLTSYEARYRQVYQDSPAPPGQWTVWETPILKNERFITLTGLVANAIYEVQILARNSAYRSSWSKGITGYTETDTASPPSPPKQPEATIDPDTLNLDTGNIVFTWLPPATTGSTDIAGYHVRYQERGAARWITVEVPAGTVEVTIERLGTSKTYNLAVNAYNTTLASDWAQVVIRLDPLKLRSPETPTSVTATAGEGFITLSWVAPEDIGGAKSARYDIQYRRRRLDRAWSRAIARGDQTEHTISGLENGVEYTVRIRTNNSAKSSHWTAVQSTPSLVPLAAPPGVTAAAQSSDSIRVTWGAPTDTIPSGYEVQYRKTGAGATWTSKQISSGQRLILLTDLSPAASYAIRVRVLDAPNDRSSPWGFPEPRSTTTNRLTLHPPRDIQAAPRGVDTIRVSWREPAEGATPSHYEIQYSQTSSMELPTQVTPLALQSATNHDVTDLAPGTTYYFQVRTHDKNEPPNRASQWKPDTSIYATTQLPIIAPGAPVLSGNVVNGTTVKLNWSQPEDTGSEPIADYTVQQRNGRGWTNLLQTALRQTTLPGRTAGTNYQFRVRANNGANGLWSNVLHLTPSDLNAPGTLTATALSHQVIQLSWTAPETGYPPTGYEVRRATDAGMTGPVTVTQGISDTSTRELGLTPDTAYYYQVRSLDNANSRHSDWEPAAPSTMTATTRKTAPELNPPTGFAAARAPGTVRTIELTWVEPADGYAPDAYQIQRSTTADMSSSEQVTNEATGSPYRVSTGLARGVTYYFQIRSLDTTSAPPRSSEWTPAGLSDVSATTKPELPGKVVNLSATDIRETAIQVSWEPPASGGAPTSYSVYYRAGADDGVSALTRIDRADSTALSEVINNLTGSTMYTINVVAVNVTGTGPNSIIEATTITGE